MLPPHGTSQSDASTYHLKKWLSLSTSFLSPTFFPTLVAKQIWITLTYMQTVHLQFPTLWTSNCLPILMRILSHIHFCLCCTLCLQGLTHSTLYSCSLSLSCPQTKFTLNSDENAHWLENLEKGISIVVQTAWPLRAIL